jgi:glycosyltransferase involved in cell wall biosynthesis
MFTFIILAYNHQNFIIEHLESIKFLIKKYDKSKEVNLIIIDDFSQDNTLFLIDSWIQLNNYLFANVEIIRNTNNKGVTSSYVSALKLVQTSKFKILSGDDLYYTNNIFSIEENYGVIFSPLIKFDESGIIGSLPVNILLNKSVSRIKRNLKLKNICKKSRTSVKAVYLLPQYSFLIAGNNRVHQSRQTAQY